MKLKYLIIFILTLVISSIISIDVKADVVSVTGLSNWNCPGGVGSTGSLSYCTSGNFSGSASNFIQAPVNIKGYYDFVFTLSTNSNTLTSFGVTLNNYACSINNIGFQAGSSYYFVSCDNVEVNNGLLFKFAYGVPNNNPVTFNIHNPINYYLNKSNQSTDIIVNNQDENSKKEQEAINNAGDKVSNSVNDVNDSLNDSSTDSPDSSFNDYNDKLAKNGVITNLITLPIQLFTNVLNSINGSCKTFNLGNLMGTDLTIPCINLSTYLGSNLWNVIDILFSGLFILVIAKKMIKVFENFSSMREGDVLGD